MNENMLGGFFEQDIKELEKELDGFHERMHLAEKNLARSLDKKQRELYKEFCKSREEYFNIAREVYQRKI